MLRLIRLLAVLAVVLVIGLTAYAYLVVSPPAPRETRVPVTLNVD